MKSSNSRSSQYRKLQSQLLVQSKSMVRIPCLDGTYGFRSNCYGENEDKLQNKITQEQFKAFIRKANRIIDTELKNKKIIQNQPFFPHNDKILKGAFALCLMGCTLLSVIVYANVSESIKEPILTISMILLVCSIVLCLICSLMLSRDIYVELDTDRVIKERLNELAQKQNEKNSENGIYYLLWQFEANFLWIELHIDWNKWDQYSIGQ